MKCAQGQFYTQNIPGFGSKQCCFSMQHMRMRWNCTSGACDSFTRERSECVNRASGGWSEKKSQNTKNCFATDFLFETLFTTVHFVLFALFERGQLKNITKSVFQFCRLAKCSGIRLDLAPTVVLMVFEVAACFFLACEDFGRMFGKSFPAWAFFFFFTSWGLARAH